MPSVTAQIPDEFIYNGQSFSLIGLKGENLFRPEDFGIKTYFRFTACWRGYVMKYIFTDDQLFLEGMRVNAKNPPNINDIEPQKAEDPFDYYYKDLNIKTKFTGKVLLAKDFIDSMYVHMGFQRPIAYKTVIEIHVKNGDMILEKDFSKKIEEYRNQNITAGMRPQSNSTKDVEKWIKQTFSLDYDF